MRDTLLSINQLYQVLKEIELKRSMDRDEIITWRYQQENALMILIDLVDNMSIYIYIFISQ